MDAASDRAWTPGAGRKPCPTDARRSEVVALISYISIDEAMSGKVSRGPDALPPAAQRQ